MRRTLGVVGGGGGEGRDNEAKETSLKVIALLTMCNMAEAKFKMDNVVRRAHDLPLRVMGKETNVIDMEEEQFYRSSGIVGKKVLFFFFFYLHPFLPAFYFYWNSIPLSSQYIYIYIFIY